MSFISKVLYFIVLHLCVFIVISAGDSELSNNPSNGKINPVHRRHFDGRKISKRHNEPDFQTCLDNFEIHQDKIIRTQDSRAMGARYINERDVPSRDDCLRLCCETADCDVFVFEERSPGSCYLFQCGTSEEFKCKFTKHKNYTSAVLALNRHMTELESQIKLTKHEHELTNLRQTDSSPTAIIPVSNTESTSLPENKETEQLVPSSSNNNSANDNLAIIRFNRRCSRYQFECRSSEECIAIYNACDGIPQCSDGSDEAPELGCPALLTTVTPAERVSQGEIPENLGSLKSISDSSLHSMPSESKHQRMHQSAPIDIEQQPRHGNKEYNTDPWMQRPQGYRSNEQPQIQQHHRHQDLQLEQQNQQQLHQQQLQEQEQQQQQQRLRQEELQHQQQLLQENRQQKLQRMQPQQEQHQQIQQTSLQQHASSNGNYVQNNNNGIQSQQLLTMSSVLPQQQPQIQQTQTQQTLQQQSQQLNNIQSPQQLVNQAKLYGREGEGLLYHSPSSVDSLHWPSNSNNNNYQQEQTQENVPYHLPNSGMSQIFNHKGNSLVSQSERAGNQFADTLPNEYNRYNNYFDNSQYRIPPHTQQNSWQSVHKPIHEMNAMDESLGGPREGESAIQSGLNAMIPDYYYEESMRNKLQQQLLAQQQRLLPQNNAPITNGEQLLQGQYKDLKSPIHEEITLDQTHHDSSTGEGSSVKKASPQHPSSAVITTEKPKETKAHHYGHNSHRKMEKLTAEVTLRETNFDGISMEQAGSPSGAILSLTLGMCVTAVMIVLVGCRMRTVRRRMRRGGKSGYAHDADFLVNGMYL